MFSVFLIYSVISELNQNIQIRQIDQMPDHLLATV